MIVLGIDPGTKRIGYALIDCNTQKPTLIDAGLLSVVGKDRDAERVAIHRSTDELLERWKPKLVAVERLFFEKNQKTAMQVAEARGIILLTAALRKTTLTEYTPLEVKKAVTGDGKADKLQVEKIVRMTVDGAERLTAHDDVFDAIAIALSAHLIERFRLRTHI